LERWILDGFQRGDIAGMRPWETFEHTADIGLIARGRTVEELFVHAAEGLIDLMVDPGGLRDGVHVQVAVSAPDREALLVAWLNELLYLVDAQGFLPSRYRIAGITHTDLAADLFGETIDPDRHTLRRLVKAATYHGLRIATTDGEWEARVIVDL